jgi:hypothetical protein
MPLRKETSNILYPFTPAASQYRDYIQCIKDALFVISGDPDDTGLAATTHKIQLTDITVGASVVFSFKALHSTFGWDLTFDVPLSSGLLRVASNEFPGAFMIVDTVDLPESSVIPSGVYLEDTRVVWQIEEVTSIVLSNEYRHHDPAERVDLTNSIVTVLDDNGDVLRLVDGYNCHLEYDDSTGTLYIQGGAGLGIGLPAAIPWDSNPIDYFSGIATINGVNDGGNVQINLGQSLIPEYGDGTVTFKIGIDNE